MYIGHQAEQRVARHGCEGEAGGKDDPEFSPGLELTLGLHSEFESGGLSDSGLAADDGHEGDAGGSGRDTLEPGGDLVDHLAPRVHRADRNAGHTGADEDRVTDVQHGHRDALRRTHLDLIQHEGIGILDSVAGVSLGASQQSGHCVVLSTGVDLDVHDGASGELHVLVVGTHWHEQLDESVGGNGVGQFEQDGVLVVVADHV